MNTPVEQLFEPEEQSQGGVPQDAVQLSTDPATWQLEILQSFQGSIGVPVGVVPVVNVEEPDESGNAMGAIQMNVGGVSLIVPVIIRSNHLLPMDVFFVDGHDDDMRPLNQESFLEIVSRVGTGMQQAPKQESGGLVDSVMSGEGPSLDALQSPDGLPSISKMSSSMAATVLLSGLAKKDDVTKLARELDRSGDGDFKKLAGAFLRMMDRSGAPVARGCECVSPDCYHVGVPDAPESHAFNPNRLGSTDVFQIRMIGPGRFQLHATLSRVYVPIVKDLSASGVRDLMESLVARVASLARHDVGAHVDELMQKLVVEGEVTIAAKSSAGKPGALLAKRTLPEEVLTAGEHVVMQEGGLQDKGQVFDRVFDFDGGQVPLKLFVSDNTSNWALQEAFVGYRTGDATPIDALGKQSQAKDARKVVLVWPGPDGVPCVSLPVQVERIETGPEGADACCYMVMGQGVRLKFDPAVSHPIEAQGVDAVDAEGRRVYFFPAQHVFVRVANNIQLVTSSAAFDKLSSEKRADVSSVHHHVDGLYTVKVGSVELGRIPWADARLFLATCGASGQEAAGLLKQAQVSGRVIVRGGLSEPMMHRDQLEGATKTAMPRRTALSDAAARRIRTIVSDADIVKIAAGVEDAGVTDGLIALRFLTPENISSFRRFIPDFELCVSRLAKLLLFSRASNQMDQQVIRKAMTLLDEVIRQLRGMTQMHVDSGYGQ